MIEVEGSKKDFSPVGKKVKKVPEFTPNKPESSNSIPDAEASKVSFIPITTFLLSISQSDN